MCKRLFSDMMKILLTRGLDIGEALLCDYEPRHIYTDFLWYIWSEKRRIENNDVLPPPQGLSEGYENYKGSAFLILLKSSLQAQWCWSFISSRNSELLCQQSYRKWPGTGFHILKRWVEAFKGPSETYTWGMKYILAHLSDIHDSRRFRLGLGWTGPSRHVKPRFLTSMHPLEYVSPKKGKR